MMSWPNWVSFAPVRIVCFPFSNDSGIWKLYPSLLELLATSSKFMCKSPWPNTSPYLSLKNKALETLL